MLYNGIRKPCRRTLTLWSRGVPQIQSVDGSPADSFILEFGREIDVVCGNLADAKRLCDLLGERLYEQVIGPFPIQIVSGIAVDVGKDGVDIFLSPAVERMALGAYIAKILMVALAVRLVGCLVGIGKEGADSLVVLLGARKNRELRSITSLSPTYGRMARIASVTRARTDSDAVSLSYFRPIWKPLETNIMVRSMVLLFMVPSTESSSTRMKSSLPSVYSRKSVYVLFSFRIFVDKSGRFP